MHRLREKRPVDEQIVLRVSASGGDNMSGGCGGPQREPRRVQLLTNALLRFGHHPPLSRGHAKPARPLHETRVVATTVALARREEEEGKNGRHALSALRRTQTHQLVVQVLYS